MINKFLNKDSTIFTLQNSINHGEKITVFGCEKDAKLTLLKSSGKSLFFVTNDIKEAVDIREKFLECGYRVEMLMDKLSFKLNPFSVDYNIKVLDVLSKIVLNQVDVVIVNPMFLLYKMPKYEKFCNKILSIELGQEIAIEDLSKKLINLGFTRSETPSTNEFAIKGDMVDICTYDKAVRVYFDFDTIEKIKEYDKETLVNNNELDKFSILPQSWIEGLDFSSLNLDDEISNQIDSYHSKINNILWSIQFSNDFEDTILDYLGDFVIGVLDTKMTFNYLEEEVKNYNLEIKESFKFADKFLFQPIIDFGELPVVGYQYITNQNRLFPSKRVFNIKTTPVPNYVGNMKLLMSDLAKFNQKKYTSILCVANKDNANKLSDYLNANKLKFNLAESTFALKFGELNILVKSEGVSINLEVEKIFILGNLNIFGKPKIITKKTNNTSFNGFLPESGDFVVHATHGIGKCIGVECLKLSSSKRDYVIIEYKNNDRLYLPVENIDLIDKYVGAPNPALHKLGGTEFLKAKERVRNNVKELAIDLKNLYAERSQLKGFVYPKDDELMIEFENSFGYQETPDQLQSMEDIKKDMEAGKVMDRLVCGDVGFGKTEVALRTAFKTIVSGKQVAFLCPTTILSQQHYNTALFRMKNFGVNIAVVNRFTSTKELSKIYEQLENGECDFVIGTHKLLNSKIKFKNLGLMILDEEQKFGVGDKEKIKNLKKNINVLTLSATPIPRTLNMSLTGIRDISVIETPPISRIPTLVSVCEFSADVLTKAVDNELERGGQVLIVYNKVESIYEFASYVKKLFPDVFVDVAHGQMEQQKLEKVIYSLYNNDIQILISTTLIENGVDLPNANTLVVINADMLGLSQLYQLKGRVGRSDRQAYAYFTYDGNRFLNDTALKRLEAITEYSSIGSGFKIALKDLEIRGAGSIFGAEQSGHIEKVGYAMYLKLLSESVSEVKGNVLKNKNEVRVETSLNAFIPNDYISDYNQRMASYLKISKIDSSQKLMTTLNSFLDTYGAVPEELTHLCKISLIKNICENIGVLRVVLKDKQVGLYLKHINEKFVSGLDAFSRYLVLETKNEPIIKCYGDLDLVGSVDLIINFLEFVAN